MTDDPHPGSRSDVRVPRWHPVVVGIFSLVPLIRFLRDVDLGFDYLMWARLADDAFYYFEIARHIPFFNDGVATSGFHPLFAFIVAPLHRTLSPESAVVGSLGILVAAHCVGTALVWRLVAKYFGNLAALTACGAWAVSGQLYSITMTGVETVLAVVLVLATLNFLPSSARTFSTETFSTRTLSTRTKWEDRGPLVFSMLFALSFLARMDTPLLLAPFAALIGVSLFRERRWFTLLAAAGLPLSVLAIWLAFLSAQTGEILPGSAAALRVLRGVDGHWLILDSTQVAHSLGMLLDKTLGFFVSEAGGGQTWLALGSGVLALAGLHALSRSGRGNRRPAMMFMVAMVAGSALWSAYYVLHLGGFRSWYFAFLALPAYCVLLPLAVIAIERAIRNQKTTLLIAGAAVAAIGVFSKAAVLTPWEYDKYHSALALNGLLPDLPPGSRIGSFNTGIYDYFSDADIVNLDGVVNPESRRAIESGGLPAYLAEHDIDFLIEHDVQDAANLYRLQRDDRLELTKVVDLRNFYEPYAGRYAKSTYLWRVKHRGESEPGES